MVINGTASSDELYANQNDQVFGLEGDDILDASNGQGNNLLDGGSGNDQLFANNNDTLKGGAGEDNLSAVGSSGGNTLEGGDDNDQLFVVEGNNNNLDGGTGDDQLTVSGGNGYNTLVGGLGNDRLNVSNPTGNNIVSGNEGDDILIGGLASDQLFGGAGDDILFGGVKGSQLTGGTGADRFYIGSAGVTEVAVEVLDFTKGQDKVVIAAIPEVQGFANLILEQTGADTTVKANIGGSVKALGILKNIQANTITANDFNFIVPIFSIANASAVEGNAIAFTITRTGDAQADQTVTVSTVINTDDTASNTDLTTKTETITFKQGETQKTFTVQTTQDDKYEKNELFTVALTNPTNGAIISSTNGTAKGTINNDDIPMAKNPDNDIFTIKGIGQARLKVTLTGQSSNLVNELGVFTVDNISGETGSDRAAYVKENLAKAEIIFSTIANLPNGFDPLNLPNPFDPLNPKPVTRVLEFGDDVKNLRFYLVRNSTTESVLRGQTSTTEVLFANTSVENVTKVDDGYSLAWEDGSGNSTDFKDLVVKLQPTNDSLFLRTKLQGSPDGSEVIDLRDAPNGKDITAIFTVYREAAYNNLVGFYQVDGTDGHIKTLTGTLNPGDDGYAQEAVRRRVADIDLRVSNQQIATFADKKFSPGAIFAPFMITNGVTVDQVLNGQVSQIYFAYIGANSDKVDHVRLLGNNIFGFEDLPGGGDRDFNDVIVKVDLQ